MTFRNWVMAFLMFAGLIVAGSDGAFFPWVNLLGILSIATAVALSKKEN